MLESSEPTFFSVHYRGDFWSHRADCRRRKANSWIGKDKEASRTRKMWHSGCLRGSRGIY